MTAHVTQVSKNTDRPSSAAAGRSSSGRDRLITLVKVALSAALIFWMIQKGALDIDSFMRLSSPSLLAFCFLCVFGQLFVNNYRWLILLRAQGFESSVQRTLPLSFIGLFFNFAMPGGVGGDVVKGYYLLREHPRQKFAAAVSIFMDRMVGFFVMIATAFLAVFFNWEKVSHSAELRSIAVAVSILFLSFLVFFFVSFSRTLRVSQASAFLFDRAPAGGKLKTIYDSIHSYRERPLSLVAAVSLSALAQLLMVGYIYVIGQAMAVAAVPLSVYFFLVPIGFVVQALPISPAGIGVGQAAFYFLFSLYLGEKSQFGPTAITSMQLMQFCWGGIGAFFYLRMKRPQ
jgi:uncharacterized protein (TIRG00374 family)